MSPAYIPDGLTAANGNGTARVIVDKSGNIVEDTVRLNFYHDYYEDGSPKLTEGVTARKGFSITASKISILSDCIYLLPENEVKTSDIDGTAVTFGYRSMPCGPYNPCLLYTSISISRFPALFQKFPTPLLDFSGFCHSQFTLVSGNFIFQKVGVCTQQSVP